MHTLDTVQMVAWVSSGIIELMLERGMGDSVRRSIATILFFGLMFGSFPRSVPRAPKLWSRLRES